MLFTEISNSPWVLSSRVNFTTAEAWNPRNHFYVFLNIILTQRIIYVSFRNQNEFFFHSEVRLPESFTHKQLPAMKLEVTILGIISEFAQYFVLVSKSKCAINTAPEAAVHEQDLRVVGIVTRAWGC